MPKNIQGRYKISLSIYMYTIFWGNNRKPKQKNSITLFLRSHNFQLFFLVFNIVSMIFMNLKYLLTQILSFQTDILHRNPFK